MRKRLVAVSKGWVATAPWKSEVAVRCIKRLSDLKPEGELSLETRSVVVAF